MMVESNGSTFHIDFDPMKRRFSCGRGTTIYEAAGKAGILLNSACGGRMKCGHCRVKIVDGDVTPMNEHEQAILGPEDVTAGFRLACAVRALGDLVVNVPPYSMAALHSMALSGRGQAFSPDPLIVAYEIRLAKPSLANPLADWENICKGLEAVYGLKDLKPDPDMLRRLSSVLRSSGYEIRAFVRNNEVIGVRPKINDGLLGLAIDIGTTKIAAYLIDLVTGRTLAAKGCVNPQVYYGEDVMSRLSYAMKGHSEELRQSLVMAINDMIGEIAGNPEEVMEMAVVGNSAMHHLFLGLPVKQLGQAPYVPVVRHSLEIKASSLGLNTDPGAYAYLLPNIAGFVGADHVAMLMAEGIYKAEKALLCIDIGTNTEIALAAGGSITTLSCASGPAFEGGGISQGMMANKGAIDKVQIENGKVYLDTIGNVTPVGICGSGVLDAISELRKHNIVDNRGRLRDHPLVKQGEKGMEFILVPAGASGTGRDIVITQEDIGAIQLAKAAIRAGINILLAKDEMEDDDISEVIIAGSFGSYFQVSSAIGIGMLPDIPLERYRQVGNAAGMGAKLALISRKYRDIAESISNKAEYIELTTYPMFSNQFSRALPLP